MKYIYRTSGNTELLQNLEAFIEANMSDPDLNARRLSRAMGMSRTVLYIQVKILTRLTVHAFITSIRLKHSLKLLAEGLPIKLVAFEVGFNSHSYFDRCFYKQFGMGPRAYCNREKALEQNGTTMKFPETTTGMWQSRQPSGSPDIY